MLLPHEYLTHNKFTSLVSFHIKSFSQTSKFYHHKRICNCAIPFIAKLEETKGYRQQGAKEVQGAIPDAKHWLW